MTIFEIDEEEKFSFNSIATVYLAIIREQQGPKQLCNVENVTVIISQNVIWI